MEKFAWREIVRVVSLTVAALLLLLTLGVEVTAWARPATISNDPATAREMSLHAGSLRQAAADNKADSEIGAEQDSREARYRGLARMAGETMYISYLLVIEFLIVFLGFCLLYGIFKFFLLVLRAIQELCSQVLSGIRAIQKGTKKFLDFWHGRSAVLVAIICVLTALSFAHAAVSEPGPAPSSSPTADVNGAYIAAAMKYVEALSAYEKYVKGVASSGPQGGADSGNLPELQQQLANAIWQAPLAILAIVLAIGAFIGYQGFRPQEKTRR
jgi:hypothetical protein